MDEVALATLPVGVVPDLRGKENGSETREAMSGEGEKSHPFMRTLLYI